MEGLLLRQDASWCSGGVGLAAAGAYLVLENKDCLMLERQRKNLELPERCYIIVMLLGPRGISSPHTFNHGLELCQKGTV